MSRSFDSAYRALPDEETRRTYRLASHHPGLDLTPDDAAALTGGTVEAAAVHLERLVKARLLERRAPGRYAFGDLAFDHARAMAEEYGIGDDPLAALVRLAYRKLRMAAAAHQALTSRWGLGRVLLEPPAARFTETTALDWLETERHTLLALVNATHQRGLHALSWQIAEAAWPLFSRRRHYGTWITMYEIGDRAARAAGDLEAQARMLQGQASAWLGRRNHGHAATLADRALVLARLSGHRHAEGTSLEQLGLAALGEGDHTTAAGRFTAARTIYHDRDDARGVAMTTCRLGEAALAAGDCSEAVEYLVDADAWFARQPNEGHLRSHCLVRLGRAYRRLGRHEDALEVLETALESARTTRAHQRQAEVLVEFAGLADDLGKIDLRQRHLREAYAIYAELGAPEAAAVAGRILPETR
ncbi:tetratricopeptide repeat protein [Actinoallomurus spadix]|uniref:Tetratricopeptide repeat protein n=1 Tax=Actinoallomurus spadix TaxID=79912 RepID=A0ABP3HN53_9ACTN|nr:tetratricopeptide repeat protein [Actinoallomurus spadix]MCO5990458.1 tetratricopeptide repeat protein [Actinoallomurus spadix]